MRTVRALQAGAYVSRRLRGLVASARLVAVFERYAYVGLEAGDGLFIFALSCADCPSGPLTVALDSWPDWSALSGAAGRLEADMLHLRDLGIALAEARVWPSAAKRLDRVDPRALADHLSGLVRRLPHASDLLSGVILDTDILLAESVDFDDFGAGLVRRDMAAIARGAAALAGLGRGLTPSGDDFLCGVATALWVFGDAPEDPCAAIADAAMARTTSLSRAFLGAATQGHVNEQWQGLLTVLGDPMRSADHVPHLGAVMAMGHSSGADTLAGFIWACRHLS